MDDPAAVATLSVLRSQGGEGAVTLGWQLEDEASADLSPLNGTLVFTEVHKKEVVSVSDCTILTLLPLYTASFEICYIFDTFQTESMKTFVVRALADTELEGDEHFIVRLFPSESGAVIDPLNGQYLLKKKKLTTFAFIDEIIMSIHPLCLYYPCFSCNPPGMATITIRADKAALGIIGIAESSRKILIGEPRGDYNGSAMVR